MHHKIISGIFLLSFLTGCGGGSSGTDPTNPGTGSTNGSPVTPTNIIAISENSKIIIKWDAVSNADSYKLSWSETKGQTQNGATIDINTGTEYSHEFLANGQQRLTTGVPYFYSLSAINSKGNSNSSQEIEGRLKNKPWLVPMLNSIAVN